MVATPWNAISRDAHIQASQLDFVAMETNLTLPPCDDSLIDACSPADKMLLGTYAAQMAADEMPWRQRSMMLSSATQFILWWRTLYTGDDGDVCLSVVSRPDDASHRLHLRESYLCFACPDRELRHEERPFLNHFLCFMEENPPCMGATPAEHEPETQILAA
jgi:hypothetical protein